MKLSNWRQTFQHPSPEIFQKIQSNSNAEQKALYKLRIIKTSRFDRMGPGKARQTFRERSKSRQGTRVGTKRISFAGGQKERKEGETKAPFSGNWHGWLRRERRVGDDTFDRAEDQTWNPIRGREKRSDAIICF